LDRVYPGSKFILTVREKESWLRSCKDELEHADWVARKAFLPEQFWKFKEFILAAVYGVHHFQRDRFSYVYDTHVRNVTDYFKGRENDFLVLDLCAGEGWEKLCPFLGSPIPSAAFPHSNTAAAMHSARQWFARVGKASAEVAAVIPSQGLFILV